MTELRKISVLLAPNVYAILERYSEKFGRPLSNAGRAILTTHLVQWSQDQHNSTQREEE